MTALRWTLLLFGFSLFACATGDQREEVETYGYASRDSLVGPYWHSSSTSGVEMRFNKDSTFLERALVRGSPGDSQPSWSVGSLLVAGRWEIGSRGDLRLRADTCRGSDYLHHSCDSLATLLRPILDSETRALAVLSLAASVGDTLRFEILEEYKCLEEEHEWVTKGLTAFAPHCHTASGR